MSERDKVDPWSEDANKKGSILQELYLEFFAIFIPGFILVLGMGILVSLCHFSIYGKTSFCVQWVSEIQFTQGFFLLLIISYAIGAILHRQRPDVPDEISALYDWNRKKAKKGKYYGAVDFSKDWENFFNPFSILFPSTTIRLKKRVPKEEKDFDFIKYPYKYLRRYLIEHGLSHLLYFVPWCDKCDDCDKNFNANRYRSRATINELKTIISCYGPKSFSSNLTRAETNIRMFTSLWYVFKYLRCINLICLLILLCCYLVKCALSKNCPFTSIFVATDSIFSTFEICLLPVSKNLFNIHLFTQSFVFILSAVFLIVIKIGIEKSIHYLRLKEIVEILNQANLLYLELSDKKIWLQIIAKEENFKEMIINLDSCKHCVYHQICFKEKNNKASVFSIFPEQQIYVLNKECCLNVTYSVKADSGDTHVK